MPLREARRVLELYPSLSLYDKLAILARLVFCARPILQVLEYHLPKSGLVIDLGCGYGVISHLVTGECPDRSVIGLDASSRRIDVARKSVDHRENMEFHVADVQEAEIPSCDAVIMIDVLSIFPYETQERILTQCYKKLGSRGIVVVKDSCKSPRWKYAYVYFEDKIKTKIGLFGKESRGHSLKYWEIHDFMKMLEEIGFHATVIPLKSRLPYPGVFYIGRKKNLLLERSQPNHLNKNP